MTATVPSHRYVIIGAGAVGAILAVELHEAGRKVLLVARGRALDAISANGVLIRRPSGDAHVRIPAAALDEVAFTASDIIVFTTKTQDLEAAIQHVAWRPLSDEAGPARVVADLPAITFQNGIEAERLALRRFSTVFGASILLPGSHLEPGVVVSPASPTIGGVYIGPYPAAPAPALLSVIVDDLVAANLATQVVDNIQAWKATKLLASVRMAVQVLPGSAEEKARLGERAVDEARAALAAAGLRPVDRDAENALDLSGFVQREIPGHRLGLYSTWQSFARGDRLVEVDHLTGEVVLLGRLHGVPTPFSAAVQRTLSSAALTRRDTDTLSAAAVLAEGERRQRGEAL